MEQLRAILQ